MDSPEKIPESVVNLADTIRSIEAESDEPSQLIAHIGSNKYLVGNISKREGTYGLEMDEEYIDAHSSEAVTNPHKQLEGKYSSFDALKQAIEKTQPERTGGITADKENVKPAYLLGSPEHGFNVCVTGINMGSGGGQTYVPIGRIIIPLIQERDSVTIDNISK